MAKQEVERVLCRCRRFVIGDARGQVSLAVAGLLAILVLAIGGLALIGQAMVEREQATVAADAVALAGAHDASAAHELAGWYRDRGAATDGATVLAAGAVVAVEFGAGSARSRAATGEAELARAPAVVAVVERARQLLADPLSSADIEANRVRLSLADASRFDQVAAQLLMCEIFAPAGERAWHLC